MSNATHAFSPPFDKSLPTQPQNTGGISSNDRRELEVGKIQLAEKNDFNLIDAFRMFDEPGNGWITNQQIVEGLNSINCMVTPSDVSNFMKVFDKDSDGRLKYSEFCDAFLPLDNEQASALAQKPPSASSILDAHTKAEFGRVWKKHFQICGKL
jgi:hypothetical protein